MDGVEFEPPKKHERNKRKYVANQDAATSKTEAETSNKNISGSTAFTVDYDK